MKNFINTLYTYNGGVFIIFAPLENFRCSFVTASASNVYPEMAANIKLCEEPSSWILPPPPTNTKMLMGKSALHVSRRDCTFVANLLRVVERRNRTTTNRPIITCTGENNKYANKITYEIVNLKIRKRI